MDKYNVDVYNYLISQNKFNDANVLNTDIFVATTNRAHSENEQMDKLSTRDMDNACDNRACNKDYLLLIASKCQEM